MKAVIIEAGLCLGYTCLFLWLIYKLRYFETKGLSKKVISCFFLLKILFGFGLYLIYTYYYTDNATSDIYKFFNDSRHIYNRLWENPEDYVRMLFGLDGDFDHFFPYYDLMSNWFEAYGKNDFSDAHTMIRFNALLRLFSFGYFNVHTVFICFLSLVGLVGLYKAFILFVEKLCNPVAIIVFLVPSVLFWGSGVLKEGLLFSALGLFVYHFTRLCLLKRVSWPSLGWCTVCVWLMLITKHYILLCLFPGCMAFLWTQKSGGGSAPVKYLVIGMMTFIIGFSLHKVISVPNPLEIIADKRNDLLKVARGGAYIIRHQQQFRDTIYISPENLSRIDYTPNPANSVLILRGCPYYLVKRDLVRKDLTGIAEAAETHVMLIYSGKQANMITTRRLEPGWKFFIASVPVAFANTLFRPFLWEANTVLIFISSVENFLMLSLMAISLLYPKRLREINMNIFLFCCSYVILLMTLAGLTTPVWGGLLRYKTPALPFMLYIFLLILDRNKLIKRWPFLSRLLQ